jgi:hypothetical protein
MASKTQNAIPFAEHPLAPLFFECVNMLKAHNFLKEAEDLIEISKNYDLPKNRNIITKISVEMQKMAVSNEQGKLQELVGFLCCKKD